LVIFLLLKTSLYRMVWKVFRYLEPFRRWLRVWQTDGRTDKQNGPQQQRAVTQTRANKTVNDVLKPVVLLRKIVNFTRLLLLSSMIWRWR